MAVHLKDISFEDCSCSLYDVNRSSLALFFGSAVCINLSYVHHTDVVDLVKLKEAVSACKQTISPGDIVLLYTGQSDRFYNTSMWEGRRTIMTRSAVEHLISLGVKNIGIDAPFFVNGLDISYPDMALTFSLSNIGHLVDMRFTYFGFPTSCSKAGKFLLRAAVLV